MIMSEVIMKTHNYKRLLLLLRLLISITGSAGKSKTQQRSPHGCLVQAVLVRTRLEGLVHLRL